MLGKIALIQQESDAAQRLGASLVNRINLISKIPFLDGIYQELSLSAGDNTITHQLGRPYLGYIILGMNAASTVYDSTSLTANRSLYLVLNSSASVSNFKLWVF